MNKNITPYGIDKPLHKWFEEVNKVPSGYIDNLIKSKEDHEKFQNLVYGNWIDSSVEKESFINPLNELTEEELNDLEDYL